MGTNKQYGLPGSRGEHIAASVDHADGAVAEQPAWLAEVAIGMTTLVDAGSLPIVNPA